MGASVVTFSSQIGTGVAQIARPVADQLGFRYYDWEVIAQAAAAAGVSPEEVALATAERAPSFVERIMGRLMGPPPTDEAPVAPPPRFSMLSTDDYRPFLEHVVRELAENGDAVIVGHSAQALLAGRAGVLKVLLYGSAAGRAERLAAVQNVTSEEARRTVAESDRQRGEYFHRVYHLAWLDPAAYDLALNVDHVGPAAAVETITAVAHAFS